MSVAKMSVAQMSVAQSRSAAMQLESSSPASRPWLIAGLYPLAAFVIVPLTQPFVANDDRGVLGTGVPWNASVFLLATTLVAATVTDLIGRRIRNHLTYTAFLWLVALSVLAHFAGPTTANAANASWLGRSLMGTLDPAQTLLGAAACFGMMFFVFIMAGAGGGDVKICTVIGAALGLELGVTALVVSHIVAGAVALSWVVFQHGPINTAVTIGRTIGAVFLPLWVLPPNKEAAAWLKFPLPMSPFFLVGTVFTLFLLR